MSSSIILGEGFLEAMDGAKMINTKSKKDLLMTFEKEVYYFNCHSSDDCYWEKKGYKFKTSRTDHVMMEVPASLVENC